MATGSSTDIEKKLLALQLIFKQQLPGRLDVMNRQWQTCSAVESGDVCLADLHRSAHSLAGSGGTFGAMLVSTIARDLEQMLKPLLAKTGQELFLSDTVKNEINNLLTHLGQAGNVWEPIEIPYIHPDEFAGRKNGDLIYLAEDDALLAADLVAKLEYANYHVQHFDVLDNFEAAFENKIPSAVIMDVVFSEGDVAGADIISKLKSNTDAFPPVIFISVRDDMEARLAAARAGANRYFSKPLDTNRLIKTLDGLTVRQTAEPFRVLIVDDDETLSSYYKVVLSDAGMNVVTLSQPLQGLQVLESFNPDVIVMDVYMPACTGPELAQVIRQDDKWAMTPIMFLSTESDPGQQLSALDLGGDDFLVKPIEANHLLAAVVARARRSRWANRLHQDLQHVVRENKYQLIAMDQHDIVSTADISGRITSVNDRFCEVSGYSRGELLGQNHRLLKSGIHPDEFYKDMWLTISSGKTWRGTICNHKKNGDDYWVESTIVPFLDDKGKPYKYVSARTDVTIVRQGEERLKRSQEFANIGTWDWNITTGDLFWSDRVWPLFGYVKEVVETTYDNFIAAVHVDDRKKVIDSVNSCVDQGVDYNIEHRVVWPDGSVHWVHESGDVVRDESGKALHMLGMVQDIDKRKQSEQLLIDARIEAENANRAKSQFLSSMSHELRTPMNAILGFSQLLKMETQQALTESQHENVDEIFRAGNHLLELINEVLDLSRIEAGRIDLSIERVELGGVIAEALQLIMPLASNRSIDISTMCNGIEISFEQLLEEGHAVRADRTRLKQILINLLSNAVKYNNEDGKINIAVHYAEKHLTRIGICDTGPGLTQEEQSRLFTAFERLGAEQSEVEGTGVGLLITKNIIELMGGNIGIESRPGEGCIFWFDLPTDDLSLEHEPAEDKAEVFDEHSIGGDIVEQTVLYIEDNPANLRLVSQLLGRRQNVKLWSAHEPLLGLELAMEHHPDLILLDINLPGMDGFEVLKQLRQRELTSKTPVIAISANAMQKDIDKGMAAGFDDYITKPVDVNALLHAVDMNLLKVKQQ